MHHSASIFQRCLIFIDEPHRRLFDQANGWTRPLRWLMGRPARQVVVRPNLAATTHLSVECPMMCAATKATHRRPTIQMAKSQRKHALLAA